MANVISLLEGDFALMVLTGFGAGFVIASLVLAIRMAVKLFARVSNGH